MSAGGEVVEAVITPLLTPADEAPALVMGIALHLYLIGQPYRLRHLRRALERVAAARDDGRVWMTTPGAIWQHAAQQAI